MPLRPKGLKRRRRGPGIRNLSTCRSRTGKVQGNKKGQLRLLRLPVPVEPPKRVLRLQRLNSPVNRLRPLPAPSKLRRSKAGGGVAGARRNRASRPRLKRQILQVMRIRKATRRQRDRLTRVRPVLTGASLPGAPIRMRSRSSLAPLPARLLLRGRENAGASVVAGKNPP